MAQGSPVLADALGQYLDALGILEAIVRREHPNDYNIIIKDMDTDT